MLTIPQALRRLKGHWPETVPPALIEGICRDLRYAYRQRALSPVVTTYLFLQQVRHGNPAANELRHLAGLEFTDAAYCQARQRLPVGFFRRLQRAITGTCRADADPPESRWHGHRVFLVDGSSFSMPDTPELRETFGQPTGQAEGCGFPTAHLLTLFDAQTGYLLKALPAAVHTHDLSQAALLHPELDHGDVLVGDRAFCSYAHLALCRRRGLHGLFRAHQRQIIDFRPGRPHRAPGRAGRGQTGVPTSRWLKRLGQRDQLVEYVKPDECPTWMSASDYAALPATLTVREVRFRVREPGDRPYEITLVTTLLDPRKYKARALAKLYHRRWQVETNLRHLKQTLKMDILRCQTVPGVVKELVVFVVVYNLVRRVMLEAAARQGVLPDRISFVDALRWLRHARPGDALRVLIVNPDRPGRVEPRVRKRRPKQFPLMKQPRAKLRQQLLRKQHAA